MTAKMRAMFLLLDAQQDKVEIELRRRVAEEAFATEPNIPLQVRSAAYCQPSQYGRVCFGRLANVASYLRARGPTDCRNASLRLWHGLDLWRSLGEDGFSSG